MGSYDSVRRKLLDEFASDCTLRADVVRAHSLDELLAALAQSYREALLKSARSSNGRVTELHQDNKDDDVRAAARERALLEIMTFFERDHVGTATVEVRRTGPDGLRVIQRAPPEDGDVAASRVAGRAFPNGAPCAAYQNRKEAS